ncbi:hypothetical protein PIB30_042643 [Stylosanthes scabra]|uniref:Uncharacterized protein n=1 Tax=Stylosanthes scabra TaxID=79078 RepID=A0ABU6QEY2_9FABA|nr:hypothetical protein [Stylosanthes scabra]
MGETRSISNTPKSTHFYSPRTSSASTRTITTTISPPTPPPLPTPSKISLVQPSQKKKTTRTKIRHVFRSVFRSFPILAPSCKFPTPGGGDGQHRAVNLSGTKVCGTLFGYRKGRVSLSLQENPRCLPSYVIELSMQTNVLQKEMAAGMVRIALECERRHEKDKITIMEEPLWTMFCNGKKIGYGMKREATEEDLHVMELLKAVSMGAGVLLGRSDVDGGDREFSYMRANFEHVVGSKDSETLYMLSPDGVNNCGPELTIFFGEWNDNFNIATQRALEEAAKFASSTPMDLDTVWRPTLFEPHKNRVYGAGGFIARSLRSFGFGGSSTSANSTRIGPTEVNLREKVHNLTQSLQDHGYELQQQPDEIITLKNIIAKQDAHLEQHLQHIEVMQQQMLTLWCLRVNSVKKSQLSSWQNGNSWVNCFKIGTIRNKFSK